MTNLLQILPSTPQRDPLSQGSSPASATSVPACYGVCCHLHHTCAHYARVDGADPRGIFMMDCGPEYAAFSARVPA
jgi:hypothetical protein